jgi:UDP-N-acetylmuramoyl-tripeptide--D-alanyl-D-alanine ligase
MTLTYLEWRVVAHDYFVERSCAPVPAEKPMPHLTLHQVRQATGGKPLTLLPIDAPPMTAVCINSVAMEKSSLFVAIRGERFDGHDFLEQAFAGGAIAAVVDHPPVKAPANLALIQVPDTRIALGKLAHHVRREFRGKVIAVAGSNGKTSTKHLIHAALRRQLTGSISPKSFNNDIGVPLAIFPANPSDDYLVLEMGTNHHGEIRPLSDMAQPDIAVIVNCGAEHLEGLTDLAGVRRENAQVISGLNPNGILIFNGDDPELATALKEWHGRRITFGFKETNDLFAANIHCTASGTEFSINGRSQRVFVPMLGRHSACNALAAIGVARAMKLPEETILSSIAKSDGPEMRLQLQPSARVTILNDAYNANPNSMRAAIETLIALESKGRRVAILGDMRELGPEAERYHRDIGAQVAASGKIDLLVCVGEHAKLIAESAAQSGMAANRICRFENSGAAAAEAPGMLIAGDMVLLKASRGIKLELVADAINKG